MRENNGFEASTNFDNLTPNSGASFRSSLGHNMQQMEVKENRERVAHRGDGTEEEKTTNGWIEEKDSDSVEIAKQGLKFS